MFQTIIVGIDGRPQDAEALALAQQLAEPGAEIIATKVAVAEHGLLRVPPRSSEADLLDEAEEIVDAFTEPRVRTEGVVTSAESIGRGLRDLALGASADLIVVASSRRGVVGRAFAGDAVADVLRHAPCPVGVATVGLDIEGPLRRVVIGYDGTRESDAALEEAVRLARRDDAAVSVVEVVEPTVSGSPLAATFDGDTTNDQARLARTRLDEIASRHGLHGVITVGHAAHELAEASRGSDLLAIGLHHYGLLDRLLVGSTAHGLLREQCAPMLITPPADPGGRPQTTDALDTVNEAT